MASREISKIIGKITAFEPCTDIYGGYATVVTEGREIRAFVPPPMVPNLTVGSEYRGQLILEKGEYRLVHVYREVE